MPATAGREVCKAFGRLPGVTKRVKCVEMRIRVAGALEEATERKVEIIQVKERLVKLVLAGTVVGEGCDVGTHS